MKFKPKFTKTDIRKMMDQKMADIRSAILSRLSFVGEEFVKMAREKTRDQGGFGDITGNLRSSIGYVIVYNGKIINENFEARSNEQEGKNKGKKLTKEIASKYPTGYALIVVAGMDYAAAVENLHHKDVITGSSLIAERLIKEGFASLMKKLF